MASAQSSTFETPFPLLFITIGIFAALAAWIASMIAGSIIPTWRAGAFFIVACIAISESVLLREALFRERPNKHLEVAVRTRELLLVMMLAFPVALILRYLPSDPRGLVDMLLNIWFDPTQYIDARDWLTVFLLLAAWGFPLQLLELAGRLTVHNEDLPQRKATNIYDDLTAGGASLPNLDALHHKLRRWLVSSVVILGIAVAVIWQSLSLVSAIFLGLALLAEAVLAAVVLALATYEVRQSRWRIENVTPEGEQAENWALSAGVLSAILTIIAILIPATILLAIIHFMLNLLVLLFAWFSQLFGHASASPSPSTTSPLLTHPLLPLPPALLHQQSHHGSTPEWLTFLALGIAAAALFVGLALFANWLHNAGRGPRLSLTGPLARVLSLLAALGLSLREFFLHLHRVLNHIGESIQQQPQRLHKTLFPRHAATGSATDIIRYWYGHTVHNAQRAGIQRQPGETTRDYRNKYENTVPAAQQEMRNLSQTYAHVRYSGQRATPEQSAAAQRQAHIIRKALQAWMRQRKK